MLSSKPIPTFNVLPDEVLQHVLFYLSPQDIVLHVQRVSKRLSRLASEPLLWRSFCKWDYKYWDSKHRIHHKFIGTVGDVDWKKLYTYRKMVDMRTTELLDSILERQISRIRKFDAIAEYGYDAKDALLRHCQTNETADDVLSRRYFAPLLKYNHKGSNKLKILCYRCFRSCAPVEGFSGMVQTCIRRRCVY